MNTLKSFDDAMATLRELAYTRGELAGWGAADYPERAYATIEEYHSEVAGMIRFTKGLFSIPWRNTHNGPELESGVWKEFYRGVAAGKASYKPNY